MTCSPDNGWMAVQDVLCWFEEGRASLPTSVNDCWPFNNEGSGANH